MSEDTQQELSRYDQAIRDMTDDVLLSNLDEARKAYRSPMWVHDNEYSPFGDERLKAGLEWYKQFYDALHIEALRRGLWREELRKFRSTIEIIEHDLMLLQTNLYGHDDMTDPKGAKEHIGAMRKRLQEILDETEEADS